MLISDTNNLFFDDLSLIFSLNILGLFLLASKSLIITTVLEVFSL